MCDDVCVFALPAFHFGAVGVGVGVLFCVRMFVAVDKSGVGGSGGGGGGSSINK